MRFLEIPLEAGSNNDAPTGLWLNTGLAGGISHVETFTRPTSHGQTPTRCVIHYPNQQGTTTIEGETNVTRCLEALRAIGDYAPAGAPAVGATGGTGR